MQKLQATAVFLFLLGPLCLSGQDMAVVSTPQWGSLSPEIHTVRMESRGAGRQLPAVPVVSMGQRKDLTLSFDDHHPYDRTLAMRIIHCNVDWNPSALQPLDYLRAFNEFPLQNFSYSSQTAVFYTHFRVEIPPVIHSGNYVAEIYDVAKKSKTLLRARFMVYEEAAPMGADIGLPRSSKLQYSHHQMELTLNYAGLDINFPEKQLDIRLLQNGRWQTWYAMPAPDRIDESQRNLEYTGINPRAAVPAWSETRTLNLSGIPADPEDIVVTRIPFPDRRNRQYSLGQQPDDLNGGSFISAPIGRNISATIGAEYMGVVFQVETAGLNEGDQVYVLGDFNNHKLSPTYRLKRGGEYYENTVYIKQGTYAYHYWVESERQPPYAIEGSFFETENVYDLFVYARPLGSRGDRLVAYSRLVSNPRD